MNEWTHCLLGSIAEAQTGPFGTIKERAESTLQVARL